MRADQKQVIGRATRTCGQKGLTFHPTQGVAITCFCLRFVDSRGNTKIVLGLQDVHLNFILKIIELGHETAN